MTIELDYLQRLRADRTKSSQDQFSYFFLEELLIVARAKGYKYKVDNLRKYQIIKDNGIDSRGILALRPGFFGMAPRIYKREVALGLMRKLGEEGKITWKEEDSLEEVLKSTNNL